MRQSRGNEPLTHLARMIGPAAPGPRPSPSPMSPPSGGPPGERSLWQRLNMEQVARRVIQTARLAAGAHAMAVLGERLAERGGRSGKPGVESKEDESPRR